MTGTAGTLSPSKTGQSLPYVCDFGAEIQAKSPTDSSCDWLPDFSVWHSSETSPAFPTTTSPTRSTRHATWSGMTS
eukprot:1435590-Prorocentrum_lima.AAC.1